MRRTSRRMQALRDATLTLGTLSLTDAVQQLKSLEDKLPPGVRRSKVNQTVEVAIRLGVDPKQSDQIVRGSIVMPHGIGKSKRVLVFAQGPNVQISKDAGATHVGGKEFADQIRGGWLEFDVAIATPDMMGVVGPLGKILGPRGLMPSPRAGTVTADVAVAIREYKAGKVEFRVDAGGIVHCVVGKISFDELQLVENVQAFLKHLMAIKPTTSKGIYVRSAYLTGTMLPSISISA